MVSGFSINKLLAACLPLALCAHAVLPDGRAHGNLAPRPSVPKVAVEEFAVNDPSGKALPPLNTTYFFDQLIDHNNPALGTFKQRFWTTAQFYEAGGPIILFTPGESNAEEFTGYLTNRTINGQIAQQEKGATIVLEHRFFGTSNPRNDLSGTSLKLLTLQQATADLAYFAKNVNLPMPGGDKLKAGQADWVLVGGSYSGALVSWTMAVQPGVFSAGYASSAVVEAIGDFFGYFDPIREGMAQNCSADVQAVITHIDQVLETGSQSDINKLKANFGLQGLTHNVDFAGSLRNNLWDWQSLDADSGGGEFLTFCDALEVKKGKNAPATGWGLNNALAAWGNFWKTGYLDGLCGGLDVEDCLGSFNSSQSFYANDTVDNEVRSWEWVVCNQVGWNQDSAPVGQPTLVSRMVQPAYDEQQCGFFFSDTFKIGSSPSPDVDTTNAIYKGWNVEIENLFFANGRRDPWREATVSASNSPAISTASQRIAISDGFHCSDLITSNGAVDSTILAVQQQGLAAIKTFLGSAKARRSQEKRRSLRFERESI